MTYNSSSKGHAFNIIRSDVEKNKIGNLVLLCGVEEFLVKWAERLLKSSYVTRGMETLDLLEIDGPQCETGDIISACETMPMMSERRVVVVRDLPVLWKNSSKNISPEAAKEFAAYLGRVPRRTLLILEGGKNPLRGEKTTHVLDAVARYGQKYDFTPLDRETLEKFILKRFGDAGVSADSAVIAAIMDNSGYFNKESEYTLYNLESDLKKMIAASQDNVITAENADAAISDSLEHDVFKMLDAVCEKRKEDAFRLLHGLLRSGMECYSILGLLCSQMELMLETKELAGMGGSIGDMMSATGQKSDYNIKMALRRANMFSESDLRNTLISAFEVDNEIKGGLLTDEQALEMFIANV